MCVPAAAGGRRSVVAAQRDSEVRVTRQRGPHRALLPRAPRAAAQLARLVRQREVGRLRAAITTKALSPRPQKAVAFWAAPWPPPWQRRCTHAMRTHLVADLDAREVDGGGADGAAGARRGGRQARRGDAAAQRSHGRHCFAVMGRAATEGDGRARCRLGSRQLGSRHSASFVVRHVPLFENRTTTKLNAPSLMFSLLCGT